MATLMEKERLLNLIAYAESIVLLRVAPADLRDRLTRFLGEQRSWILAVAPEAIDINAIAPAIQDIIEQYKNHPVLSDAPAQPQRSAPKR